MSGPLEMYENQHSNVRWDGVLSNSFPVTNGVKQGAGLFPILYCIYIDGLVTRLRRKKTGCCCWVNSTYMLESLHTQMTCCYFHQLLLVCEDYGNTYNLTFSTDPIFKKCKTKCLAFLKKERYLKNI